MEAGLNVIERAAAALMASEKNQRELEEIAAAIFDLAKKDPEYTDPLFIVLGAMPDLGQRADAYARVAGKSERNSEMERRAVECFEESLGKITTPDGRVSSCQLVLALYRFTAVGLAAAKCISDNVDLMTDESERVEACKSILPGAGPGYRLKKEALAAFERNVERVRDPLTRVQHYWDQVKDSDFPDEICVAGLKGIIRHAGKLDDNAQTSARYFVYSARKLNIFASELQRKIQSKNDEEWLNLLRERLETIRPLMHDAVEGTLKFAHCFSLPTDCLDAFRDAALFADPGSPQELEAVAGFEKFFDALKVPAREEYCENILERADKGRALAAAALARLDRIRREADTTAASVRPSTEGSPRAFVERFGKTRQ